MFKVFEIFSFPNVPFIIKEDFVGSETEEGLIFVDFICEVDLSVTGARGGNGVAEDVVGGFEGFVIEFHPSGFFLADLDFGGVGVAHDISNLNYYGKIELNKIYLVTDNIF